MCVCYKWHISNDSQKNVRFIAQILLNCPAKRSRYILLICWTFIAKNLCKPNQKKEKKICFVLNKKRMFQENNGAYEPLFWLASFFYLLGFKTLPFRYFRAFRFKLRRQLIKRGMFLGNEPKRIFIWLMEKNEKRITNEHILRTEFIHMDQIEKFNWKKISLK